MATLSLSYASTNDTTAITLTAASLASSSTWLAGRESTVVSNTSNLYVDALLSGQITVGTSPTSNTFIRVYLYSWSKVVSSTVTYPDSFTGSDAAKTVTATGILQQLPLVTNILCGTTTSNRAYHFGPVSVASRFGGVLPSRWGIFLAHNTGVNLNSTGSNHWFHYQGIKLTSA